MEDFPSNSHRKKTEPTAEIPNEKNVEKIVTGPVITRRPSGFKRLRQSFIKGDATSVGEHVLWNVVVPAAQDIVAEMGATFIDMMIYGESRRGRLGGGILSNRLQQQAQSTSKFNYAGVSGGSQLITNAAAQMPQMPIQQKDRFIPNEVIVSSRAEAEEILLRMNQLIERFTAVTVADLYRLIGRSIDYTDDKWGWKNLEMADAKRVGQGVLLVLPMPEPLD